MLLLARACLRYLLWMTFAEFVFAITRLLWLEPRAGQLGSVSLVLPPALAFLWAMARRTVRLDRVPPSAGARWAVGAGAAALLVLGEVGLAELLMVHDGAATFLRRQAEPAGLLGVVGLLLAAAFPRLQLSLDRRREDLPVGHLAPGEGG